MVGLLGLIESPLQLDNFLSYLKYSKCKNASVIVRLNGNAKNDNLLENRLNEISKTYDVKISCKKFIVRPGSIKIFFLFFYALFICLFIKPKTVIIGDYRSIWNKYLFFLFSKKSEFVFVDDGLATLAVYEKISTLVSVNMNLVFYTCFDLKGFSNLKVIKTNNHSIKLHLIQDKQIGILIGSPLVEKEIVDKSTYIKLLLEVIRDNECELTYCYHRSEFLFSESDLLDLGFVGVVRLDCSFEDALKNGLIKHYNVLGFYSTALVNTALSFEGVKLTSYIIPERYLLNNKENIKEVYRYLSALNDIEVKKCLC